MNDTTLIKVSSDDDTCHYRQNHRGKKEEVYILFLIPLHDSIINDDDYITEYSKTNHKENFTEHF